MNCASQNQTLNNTWSNSSDPGAHAKGARIVVVDDDRAMRELLTERLTSEGYEVHDAISGVDLMRVLESIEIDQWPLEGVDLIVLDNRMPGMTGLEAIRRLRAAHWEIPAILITAFPEPDVKREAAALRMSLLPKPFSLELLTTAVYLSLVSKPEDEEHHRFRVPS